VLACTILATGTTARSDFYLDNEILSKMFYICRNRNFSVQFNDPAHEGFGHQHLAWIRGSDSNGRYADVSCEEVDVPVSSILHQGDDGAVRIYLDTTPPKAILLDAGCGESNCLLYDGKPLFGQRDTGPIDPPQWSDPNSVGVYGYYGYTGYGRGKVGMEVALPEPASLSLLALGGVAAMRRGRTRR
ncbi:MAG: hypothetical protein NT031_13440, partial [Planctomycetota bacterium]|nr:hypothetical protein [Planctomycetota bacterium]